MQILNLNTQQVRLGGFTFTVEPDIMLEFCFGSNTMVHHIIRLMVSNL
jgi:hypothetical protein